MDRIRVLLADDHEAILDRVTGLLATECNVVGTATDGQQALDAAMELKPDILVLDISMPVMNGIETRLAAVGVGPLAPIDTNHTEYGRSQNRRVELVLIK